MKKSANDCQEIDTETVKVGTAKTVPTCVLYAAFPCVTS